MLKSNFNEAELTEDFGIGVGAPLGADQGIPYGGDGKAVAPCYMGMTSRFGSVGNKATGFGKLLWPKRRKKRKKHIKHNYPNFVQESLEDDRLTPENIASFLESIGLDDHVYTIHETDDNNIIVELNTDPVSSIAVQDTNDMFAVAETVDFNSAEQVTIIVDRLSQTATIRIGEEDMATGLPCADMTNFETVYETLENLTEQ